MIIFSNLGLWIMDDPGVAPKGLGAHPLLLTSHVRRLINSPSLLYKKIFLSTSYFQTYGNRRSIIVFHPHVQNCTKHPVEIIFVNYWQESQQVTNKNLYLDFSGMNLHSLIKDSMQSSAICLSLCVLAHLSLFLLTSPPNKFVF